MIQGGELVDGSELAAACFVVAGLVTFVFAVIEHCKKRNRP